MPAGTPFFRMLMQLPSGLVSPGCRGRQRLGGIDRDLDSTARFPRFLSLAIVNEFLIPESDHMNAVHGNIVASDQVGNHLVGARPAQRVIDRSGPSLIREPLD